MPDTQAFSLGLLDRLSEKDALDGLVTGVRTGQSHVLVLRGEAGVGKTALLRHLPASADGCRVTWTTGVESEMELAFAGLHALCAPLLGGLERLPEPQRDALSTAFGLSAGLPPERFVVGLAVLGLLADAADEQPLVFIVDDAQWLDQVSAQTIAFVARRLLAERVGFVFAVRDLGGEHAFEGFPEVLVEGLPPQDARALLDAAIPGPLDEQVKTRILDETRGNPLALMQLPRGLTPADLAGGFGFLDARALSSRIEHSFLRRVDALSRETQLLLLTAAAEPLGDVSLLWRAAERLDIGGDAGLPAEAAGLIELGPRVRFPHPLIRSAIYRASDPSDRCNVRRALAESTDPVLDPDRRAWHRAYATTAPDEEVAAEMELSSDRARGRGGLAAAAAFLQRAAELTPDPAMRVERSLAAAQAKLDVADTAAASVLLATAELGPLEDLQYARLERLRAQVVFTSRRGGDAPSLLLETARRLDPLDGALARETYLEAIAAAMSAGRLNTGPNEREIAEAAAASQRVRAAGKADLLLDSLVTRYTDGYAQSVAPLSSALRAFAEADVEEDDARWFWLACRLAQDLWDDELWYALATRAERVARETGALSQLANALNHLAAFSVHSGDFATAAVQIDELDLITQATGLPPLKYSTFKLAASRGDQAEIYELYEHGMENAKTRGEGAAVGGGWGALALLHNSNGQYSKAFAAARTACEYEDIMTYGRGLIILVESGTRDGHPDEARTAFERLRERTQASGTEWALGVEARCRALLGDDEASYRESVDRLAKSRAAIELARSQLLYGEWLRRENRRTEARAILRAAYESFSTMGAQGFAERSRRELVATGETARRRTSDTREILTPQELQVARLARDGHTNPEIGAQLFISPRTVEYHLGKVFVKLGIKKRRDLRDALDKGFHPSAVENS
jgi:DNA-binding CsgD family transcriptional regulator